ncbi:MAG: ribose-5-phosphate isomerase A [Betaproteobacteria bacterium]|nr:ribose-5-phosphate isomerase A [Betaproteobacteria bacterium]
MSDKQLVALKAATHFITVADTIKLVSHIGKNFMIPIEVIPFSWKLADMALIAENGTVSELGA